MRKRCLLACAAVALILGRSPLAQDSPLVSALKDELARSMSGLRIKTSRLRTTSNTTSTRPSRCGRPARLGAVEVNEPGSRLRTLSVEVRVGDYQFDSSRFVTQGRGGFAQQAEGSAVATLDDNYDAIRRQLWLATDAAYKRAISTFARKKAAFQNRATTDPLPDFSREAPVTTIRPTPVRAARAIDWVQRARDLSAVLTASPHLQSSAVSIAEQYGTHYFLNSEGFTVVLPIEDASFVVSGDAQADDGMTLRASYRVPENRLEYLPPLDVLMAGTRAVGERLAAARTAPVGEEYTGPVLFEGRAGAEVIAQSFVPLLLAQRPPDTDNPRMVRQVSTPFLSRIGLRVMSESLSVSDTPSLQQFAGRPVPGAYEVDDEGVPAQDVPLVENGRLVMLLTNRTPNRNLPQVQRPRARQRAAGRRGAGAQLAASPRGRVEGETAGAAETPEQGLRLHRPQHRRAGVAADRQGDAGRERADRARGEHRRRAAVGFPRHPRSLVRVDALHLSHRRRPGLGDRPGAALRRDRDRGRLGHPSETADRSVAAL